MKIARVQKDGRSFYAARENEGFRRIAGLPYEKIEFTEETYAADDVTLLAPSEPSKVVAVGLNYAKHAGEMKEALTGNPVLFIKASTSVLPPGGTIVYPEASQRVDYEAELAVVIGKTCKNVTPETAKNYIFGYTALNDVPRAISRRRTGSGRAPKASIRSAPSGR
jgi:2-keto-4-pentenoate hydratase/2-oxohepta-3-ene-1,7-dioic acid hydratase in catechol pathway